MFLIQPHPSSYWCYQQLWRPHCQSPVQWHCADWSGRSRIIQRGPSKCRWKPDLANKRVPSSSKPLHKPIICIYTSYNIIIILIAASLGKISLWLARLTNIFNRFNKSININHVNRENRTERNRIDQNRRKKKECEFQFFFYC